MTDDSPIPKSPLDDFLEALRRDVDDDALRPLADYLARFPGDDSAITGEYRAAIGKSSPSASGSFDARADHIGPYRILRDLGRGGQATVYLAEDTRLHREVALKVLDSGPVADRVAFERFRREAEITSKLNHPGICAVYETGEARGVRWIAMRYVEGESLATRISTAREHATSGDTSVVELPERADRQDAIPPGPGPEPPSGPKTWSEVARVVALFEDAARTLHVAHEFGVIHRDLKPGNIMVAKDGNPVILDFGLAQEVTGDRPTLTHTGDVMGTPAYMSPEQITGQRIRLDRRTDVYSLGVSLYECLTLRRPFDAPTREAIYQAILTKNPPDIRELNRSIPKDLKIVIETAIEKDRDRRYQTAHDFAEDLRRVRGFEPILARPAGPMLRLRRWSQRNPALATALACVLAALVVSIVLLVKVSSERNAKKAALADYDRLGDLPRYQALVAQADTLWPASPSNASAMTAWLRQASDLLDRLPAHRALRDRLRSSNGLLPYADEDRAAGLNAHAADQEQLRTLSTARDKAVAALAAAEARAAAESAQSRSESTTEPAPRQAAGDQARDLRSAIAALDAEIQRVDARVHERLTWRFESSSDQFKHDTTATLVAGLTEFLDPDPLRSIPADMRRRLAFAESVESESIGKHQARWAAAIRSIADPAQCPKYHGLVLTPQLGLIPIARNPASGLWEFAHVQTAAQNVDPVPKVDQDGRIIVTEAMGLVLVLIPGGTFRMGALPPDKDHPEGSPNADPQAEAIESPLRDVALNPFFLSKYEMTQGQWLRFVGRNPSVHGPGATVGGKTVDLRHPVEGVTWADCDRWIGRLGLSLPTEAQWEYATRATSTTPWWPGVAAPMLAGAANLADAYCRTHGGQPSWSYETWEDGYSCHAPVGSYLPNAFGLHDVHGNVWEWTRDWFGTYDEPLAPGDGRRLAANPQYRVFRGGCFVRLSSDARSSRRYFNLPQFRIDDLGVRPSRAVDW